MICSCKHEFTPTAETYCGTQLYTESTGAVWLYLLLHNCPSCGSTRAQTMFCDEPEAAEEAA